MDFTGVFMRILFSTNNLSMVVYDGSAAKDFLTEIVRARKRLVLLGGWLFWLCWFILMLEYPKIHILVSD